MSSLNGLTGLCSDERNIFGQDLWKCRSNDRKWGLKMREVWIDSLWSAKWLQRCLVHWVMPNNGMDKVFTLIEDLVGWIGRWGCDGDWMCIV